MEQKKSAGDRIRRVLVHLLDLAVLVKAHLTGFSVMGIWAPEKWGYEDDPVQGLRVVVVLVVVRLLVGPASLPSRRTFRFLFKGLENPLAAGATTGGAMLGAMALGWTYRHPLAEISGLDWFGHGLGLLPIAFAVGAGVGLGAGGLAVGLGRILPRFGLLHGDAGPSRLAAILALGMTVGVAPELDPTTDWDQTTTFSPAFGLLLFGHLGLAWLFALGRGRRWTSGIALSLVGACFPLFLERFPVRDVPENAPRGILLITIDTLRADHVGCYGYERDTTPRLDALAKESTLFERAFAPMPSTDPSHVSILTGLLPRSTGVMANGYPIARPDQVTTLAERCRAVGYRTGAITSRAHLNPVDLRLEGFQTYSAPTGRVASTEAKHALTRASRWIERFGDEPFFLWVHVWDPHAPYDPPREPERSMFGPYEGLVIRRGTPGGRPLEDPYSKEEMARAIALYDGEIRYADDHVGRIIDAARERVGRENLLVIVTADHGETLDEHDEEYRYALDHSELLAPQEVHVPLIVSWPGRITEGRRIRDPVSIASITPSVGEIVDVNVRRDASEDVDSLAALWLGETHSLNGWPLLLERRIFLEPARDYLSVPETGFVDDGWMYVENARRGRFTHPVLPHGRRPERDMPPADGLQSFADRLRILLLEHPRVEIDVDAVPEDRENALHGLGYGR